MGDGVGIGVKVDVGMGVKVGVPVGRGVKIKVGRGGGVLVGRLVAVVVGLGVLVGTGVVVSVGDGGRGVEVGVGVPVAGAITAIVVGPGAVVGRFKTQIPKLPAATIRAITAITKAGPSPPNVGSCSLLTKCCHQEGEVARPGGEGFGAGRADC